MKILTICIIGLFLVSFSVGILMFNEDEGGNQMEEERLYHGPVRPTDDEEIFRKTGETKPLEVKQ